MYSPSSVPTSLAAMLDFLLPTVESGLFDSVEYDDESSPTKIVCKQGGETILDVIYAYQQNLHTWLFIPYVASGTPANAAHSWHISDTNGIPIASLYRCSGGVFFKSQSRPYVGDASKFFFIIAKTSADKTGFILYKQAENYVFSIAANITYYVSGFGDNTSLALYTGGYKVQGNSGAGDRTILTKLPVVGILGSTDYFTTAYVRNVVQYTQTGVQLIGNKKYFCVENLAIEDEEE